jgi:UDP-2,4-diacetamido-2,4,6-trideoxy-beta-L-altropyranose hydrolase
MGTGPPLVLIRSDATRELGLGHLRRCATLARALQNRGFAVRFVRRRGDALKFGVGEWETSTLWIDGPVAPLTDVSAASEADANELLRLCTEQGLTPAWAVVDHYGLSDKWEAKIRAAGVRVVAIDDFRDRSHAADLLVSDSPEPIPRSVNAVESGVHLTGPKYALVDAPLVQQPALPMDRIVRILVSYGSTDASGESEKAVAALRIARDMLDRVSGCQLTATLVVGPSNERGPTLLAMAAAVPGVRVVMAPVSLTHLILEAHLVLTAGGNTLMETVAGKRLAIVTITASNQERTANYLVRQGVIVVLGDHASVTERTLAEAIVSSATPDSPVWRRLADQTVYDACGAERVADTMLRLFDSYVRTKPQV